jgi:hypothetical protein
MHLYSIPLRILCCGESTVDVGSNRAVNVVVDRMAYT